MTCRPRIAIAHDFLASVGGAERVVLALADLYPDAPIYTSFYDADATYEGFRGRDIRTLSIDRIPGLRRNHRYALPVLQRVFASATVDADVVICSSTGFSHHIRASGKKLVYCHSPARWLYDDNYLSRYGLPARIMARTLRPTQRPADQRAMHTADAILANSKVIAEEIRHRYERDATVVAPCSSIPMEGELTPIDGLAPGFVLCPSRAVGYKRLELLAQAAQCFPESTFVHVGGGPAEGELRAIAPENLQILGVVADSQLRWAYQNTRLVVLTAAEDFGLVPLEASAYGVWSVVPRARGFLDHVIEGKTGDFYEWGSIDSLVATLRRVDAQPEPGLYPERLNRARFEREIEDEVAELVS